MASLGQLPVDINRGPEIVGITSSFFALATVLIALRLFVRIQKHAHGWDDYMIYIAWVRASHLLAVSRSELKVLACCCKRSRGDNAGS